MITWSEYLLEILSEAWMRGAVVLGAAVLVAMLLRFALTVSIVRWATRSRSDVDDQIVAALRRPLSLTVLLVGVALAILELESSETTEGIVVHTVATVTIFMWMFACFRLCHLLVRLFSSLADRVAWIQPTTVPLVENLLRVGLVVVAVYFLMQTWSLDVAPWLASAGVLGIALGFAAKDTLANLFGGFFVIMDGPYKIGDYINLDSGERGEVTRIGLRTTRVLTRDDIEITVPNALIANSKIINEAGGRWEKSRIRVKVGVAYGSDVALVRKVLIAAADSVEYCDGDPEPRVRFREFGESSLNFELLAWIASPELRGRCIDALLTDIYERFQREGIQIPFPQRDVHVRTMPPAGQGGAGAS